MPNEIPPVKTVREQAHDIVADHERRQKLAVVLAEAHGDKWEAITAELRRLYYGIACRAEPAIKELYCDREVKGGIAELHPITDRCDVEVAQRMADGLPREE